jgi:hypothetical protein
MIFPAWFEAVVEIALIVVVAAALGCTAVRMWHLCDTKEPGRPTG